MRVILVGASGILGNIVLKSLKEHGHDIITVSRTGKTDLHVDIADPKQIEKMYNDSGSFDALISTAGHCWIGPFAEMKEEHFYAGIKNKLMSQVNLVMIGKECISENGSFTLTSGFISDDPLRGTIGYSVANGGIDNFVLAAAIELKRGIRINAVSPGWVTENYDGRMDGPATGQWPVEHNRVAHAYYKSAFGYLSGQVYKVWEPSTQYARK